MIIKKITTENCWNFYEKYFTTSLINCQIFKSTKEYFGCEINFFVTRWSVRICSKDGNEAKWRRSHWTVQFYFDDSRGFWLRATIKRLVIRGNDCKTMPNVSLTRWPGERFIALWRPVAAGVGGNCAACHVMTRQCLGTWRRRRRRRWFGPLLTAVPRHQRAPPAWVSPRPPIQGDSRVCGRKIENVAGTRRPVFPRRQWATEGRKRATNDGASFTRDPVRFPFWIHDFSIDWWICKFGNILNTSSSTFHEIFIEFGR